VGVDRIIAALVAGKNFSGDLADIFLGLAPIRVRGVDAAGLSLSNNHSRSPFCWLLPAPVIVIIIMTTLCNARLRMSTIIFDYFHFFWG
jgi:hypothetical protein